MFLFYWFRSGRIKTLVDLTHECKSKKAPRAIKLSVLCIFVVFTVVMLLAVEINVLKMFFDIKTAFMNPKIDNPWNFWPLTYLSTFIGFYKSYVFHLMFFVYIGVCSVLFVEFEDFNESLISVKF